MINFYEDAWPALVAMSEFEPDDPHGSFSLTGFLKRELGHDQRKSQQIAKLLLADDFISAIVGKANGMGDITVHHPELTPKALKLLGLWPTEDAEITFLLAKIGDALDMEADNADEYERPAIRAAGRVVRDLAISLAAALATGGSVGG